MTISTKYYVDLKFTISGYLQYQDWNRLFEVCCVGNEEVSKTIASIFTLYDPKHVWNLIDYAKKLPREERIAKKDCVATICYVLGKMGQSNTTRAISILRQFLCENHQLRTPISAALSNLWVLDSRATASALLHSWILNNHEEDEALFEVSVISCEYIASQAPDRIVGFLRKVSSMVEHPTSAKIAREFISRYISEPQLRAKKIASEKMGKKAMKRGGKEKRSKRRKNKRASKRTKS